MMLQQARWTAFGTAFTLIAAFSAAIAAQPGAPDARDQDAPVTIEADPEMFFGRAVFDRVQAAPLHNGPESGFVRSWHTIVIDEDALFGNDALARQASGEPVLLDLIAGRRPFRAMRTPTDLGLGETESWYGEILGHPGAYALFVRHKGAIAGKALIPDVGLFEILDAGNGISIVREIDDLAMPPCGNTEAQNVVLPNASNIGGIAKRNIDNNGGEVLELPSISTDRGAFIFADVLLLYTTQARVGAGGVANIEAQLNLAIADCNIAYESSGVTLRVRLAAMFETPYMESPSLSTDLSRLANLGDGFIDEAHSLRSTYSADLVALIPATSAAGACGVGYLMSSVGPAFASLAFSVTARTCLSNQTLAHELGHNMGCHHDRNNAGGGAAYSFSFGHRDVANAYRTVMAYAPGQRTKLFSNPNVNFPNGQPSGVPVESPVSAYNALGLEMAAPTIAAWRILYMSPPSAFNLQTPESGATTPTRNVTFTWTGAAETDYYQIIVDNDPNFTNPEIDFAPITETTFVTPHNALSLGTQYYWKVIANNPLGSATSTPTIRSFFTPAVAPSDFTLNAPANGAVGVSSITSFQWSLAPNAETYALVVDDDPDFSSPVINISGITSASYTTPLVPNTTYYWQVTATNVYGSTASTPETRSFTTVGVAPNDFALVSPPDGPNVPTTGPLLTWTASQFADSYQILVDDSVGLESPEYHVTGVVGTSHQIPTGTLTSGIRYYWRVIATNSVGTKVSSPNTYSFGVLVPFCMGDADRSLAVNFNDISSVLSNWGGSGPMGDANNDGVVNFQDISSVLSNWGAQCSE